MHLYGLIIGISLIIGIDYYSKHQKVIPQKRLSFFLVGLIIISIIGARLYHVADNWSFYSQNPWLIPQTWNGGLGIFGAIIAALLYVLIFSQRSKISIFSILDNITPILPLCQSIGRLGNFVNHENPVWWPEAVLDLLLFLFIRRHPQNPTGKYLVGYGLIRFVTEFFRTETWQVNSFKIAQIISTIFIVLGLTLLNRGKLKISQDHS